MKEIKIIINDDNCLSIKADGMGSMEVYGLLDYTKRYLFVQMGRELDKAKAAPKSTSHNNGSVATESPIPSPKLQE